MFSPKFYSISNNQNSPCGCGGGSAVPTGPQFDFYINCNNDQYGIQEVINTIGRIVELKVFLWNGHTYQEVQSFTPQQFGGAFFSNIKTQDQDRDGDTDLVADVYDNCCHLLGTAVLVNDCQKKNPCASYQLPCYDPWQAPCPPPPKPPGWCGPCPNIRISRSDIAKCCKLVEVDIVNSPVTSVNEICIKPVPPINSEEKLCQLLDCCKKTAHCLETFDPCYPRKIKCKGKTSYSGPVKATDGVVDVNACTITFSGMKINCSDFCGCK